MGRKAISPEEKREISHRIASGMPLRKAIEGTSATSLHTAHVIAHSNETKLARERMLQLIEEKYEATEDYQAQKLVQLLDATLIKTSMTEPDKIVPDNKIRLSALQYLHKLKGINVEEAPQVHVTLPTLILDAHGRRPTDVQT